MGKKKSLQYKLGDLRSIPRVYSGRRKPPPESCPLMFIHRLGPTLTHILRCTLMIHPHTITSKITELSSLSLLSPVRSLSSVPEKELVPPTLLAH